MEGPPFGLASVLATFLRLMEKVLHGLHWKCLLLYLDDIIAIAPDFDSYVMRLEEVFKRLQQANLKLAKQVRAVQRRGLLPGTYMGPEGVATDLVKIEVVQEWEPPNSVLPGVGRVL